MSATINRFLTDAEAEVRHVICSACRREVLGHLPACPHCQHRFHANQHGYARLCKNPSCRHTEDAGHAHGLCRDHYLQRKARQANSALQPNCRCGNKATHGLATCSGCRNAAPVETIKRCPHGVKMIFGNVCSECDDDYRQMRRDDQQNYECRG